ncbi:hypothetical protein [Dyadobacter helix]|nr:hypothetical protein [Dyadobacter sp. CECT 9275]
MVANLRKMHEWLLAARHREALKAENYELCKMIQEEIDERIENNTINHAFMDGFRYWDKNLKKFTGPPNFGPYNGLFKNYKYHKENERDKI